ncbi:MAG: N-acetylmuramoyl-L-alanine amidase [Defluviitaleaceae bacterium]|nr:N-acetylmuramoyl-L-alanine amidase [Defluviitaleaceae bacterium]
MKKIFFAAFFIAIIFSATTAYALPLSRKIIVLDAGHGGWDPGKVQGQTEEKHINLAIALKVQTFLEQGGATVIVTRIDDSELSKSKRGDMYARQNIANASHADIFVSIHQNSFSKGGVHGAQVFYFDTSGNSERLARAIQERLREFADPSNRLKHRANDNYYVLKQTKMPAVLVECGFLTNYNERQRLLCEDYQEKIAWSIYLGIIDYFYEDCGDADEEAAQ